MVQQWDIYYPAKGVKFFHDTSGKEHMLLIISGGVRVYGNPFFAAVQISHLQMSYTIRLEDVDVAYAVGGSSLSNTNNALCGLVFTVGLPQIDQQRKVGCLADTTKREDILDAVASRLGIPPPP